jgi:hypothetical protein
VSRPPRGLASIAANPCPARSNADHSGRDHCEVSHRLPPFGGFRPATTSSCRPPPAASCSVITWSRRRLRVPSQRSRAYFSSEFGGRHVRFGQVKARWVLCLSRPTRGLASIATRQGRWPPS